MPRKPKATNQTDRRNNVEEKEKNCVSVNDNENKNNDVETSSNEQKQSSAKYNWFELILYPQDEQQNKNKSILDFVTSQKYQYDKCVYITHDRDIKESGELKKSHVHCIIHSTERISCKQLKKRLVYLNYEPHHTENQIRPVTEGLTEALLYLTHESLRAIFQKKVKYDKSELKGDAELINQIIVQNRNYIQNEIFELLKECPYTLDVFKCADSQYTKATALAIKEEYMKYGAFYQTIAREEQYRRKNPNVYKYCKDTYIEVDEDTLCDLLSKVKERYKK